MTPPFDSIVIFIDKLSKEAVLVPACEAGLTAEAYADLCWRHIFSKKGLPKKIISDKDGRFESHFWTGIAARLGTKLNKSSAFHPQTDG